MKALTLMACACLLALLSAPPLKAQETTSGLSVDSTIGELLDNPQSRAILAAHIPNFVDNPGVAGVRDMPLRLLQQVSPQAFSQSKLDEVALALSSESTSQSRSASAANRHTPASAQTSGTSSQALSVDSTIGALIDDPSGRAVLEQQLPGLMSVSDINRLRPIPLSTLQKIAPQIVPQSKINAIGTALQSAGRQ